jgi:hypothetical protein
VSERVVGLEPWLPSVLRRSAWLTEPVPAVRLAALRIGVGLAVLGDVLVTYMPHMTDLYGEGSLGGRGVFPQWFLPERWTWSLFAGVSSPNAFRVIAWVWALAALMLALGVASRGAAACAWAIKASLLPLDPAAHYAGDMVGIILLSILMLSPCGATWSVDAWWRKRRFDPPPREVRVHPWPLRLVMLQMTLVYFGNGLHKITFEHGRAGDWLHGEAVYAVIANLNWARFPYPSQPMPYAATWVLTWIIFVFELGFPMWMLFRRTRAPALFVGAAFHVGLWLFMEVAFFPALMLCLYLPLVPWERLQGRRARAG